MSAFQEINQVFCRRYINLLRRGHNELVADPEYYFRRGDSKIPKIGELFFLFQTFSKLVSFFFLLMKLKIQRESYFFLIFARFFLGVGKRERGEILRLVLVNRVVSREIFFVFQCEL